MAHLPDCKLLLAVWLLAVRFAGSSIVLGTSTRNVSLHVDWDRIAVASTHTAATIEVDVMPFLSRAQWGGPFDSYYSALSGLGAEFVRFAPWFPNPRAVVTELTPSDCTPDKPATNWNSSVLDEVMQDFQAAVCGLDAANGKCDKSVVQQLSTMPSYMFKDGFCSDASTSCLPDYAWNCKNGGKYGNQGVELVDPTCGQVARYIGRLVGHYTAGGHHDECGHWHASGLHYQWWGLSIWNENEHQLGSSTIRCYDAVVAAVEKINPNIVPVGPELVGDDPTQSALLRDFLNSSKHADGKVPPVVSYHLGSDSQEDFWSDWDSFLYGPSQCDPKTQSCSGVVPWYQSLKEAGTELVINEFIPFITDWCDSDSSACSEKLNADSNDWYSSVRINRKTWSWNAAAAYFAYAFGTLAERQYKYVAVDQLIGGPWPDNEPSVTCLDWSTGQPNAKYWVTQLLATTIGTSAEKTVFQCNVTDKKSIYAMPYSINQTKGMLLVNKAKASVEVTLLGVTSTMAGAVTVVEVDPSSEEAGFTPPVSKRITAEGRLSLGPYAVAVITRFEEALMI